MPTAARIVTRLSRLSDVSISNANSQEVLSFDGTSWKNKDFKQFFSTQVFEIDVDDSQVQMENYVDGMIIDIYQNGILLNSGFYTIDENGLITFYSGIILKNDIITVKIVG